MVLTDAQWVALEPVIGACRPHRETDHHDLRQTIEAIVWRCRNGAKWRSVPAELGPWWKAAQTFIRWARPGVWERVLTVAREKGIGLGMSFLDGTNIRARQKAAGAAKKGAMEHSVTCVIADSQGRAVAFTLAPGPAHELPHAIGLLGRLPGVPRWVVADRGYTSHTFRQHIWDVGSRPAIAPRRHEASVACPPWIYNNRNRVERLWARLKEWRAVATRHEKTATSFVGALHLAAALNCFKN